MGCEITRISLRGWDLKLGDEDDFIERARTRYVLRYPAKLLLAAASVLVKRPARLMRTVATAWRMSRVSPRPLYVHLAYVVEACQIVRWLSEAGVEHLHAHFGTNSAEVAMFVHMLGGPRWSFTIHGPEEYAYTRALHLTEKIKASEFTVAVASFGRAQLFFTMDRQLWSKVHVIHCGVDSTFLNAPAIAGALNRRFICVGRLSPEKGHLVLLEATRLLANQGTDFELVLVGDGDLRHEMEAVIAEYNLRDKVRLTGWLNGQQVRDEILAARALILPSFAEGLPLVLMEAMALRRPVIATYVGGIPELVRVGEEGWLVPPGDSEALAEAMQSCVDSPADLIARMGETAHKRIVLRHNVNTEAAKLKELFSQVQETKSF
jgi:glycosyltransferase involved in cell wall biosynthesis